MFDRADSIAVLRRRVPHLAHDQAERLAEALGDLPLALSQAWAHLADSALPLQDYLTLLAERTRELLAQGTSAIHPVSLTASTQITLDRLAAQSPAALLLLTLAAYLAPEPIPMTLVTSDPDQLLDPLGPAAADPLALSALTGLLRQYGLIRSESSTFTLHRLIAAILRSSPHSYPALPTRVIRLLRSAVPAHPADNPQVWSAWRRLLPHVLVATGAERIVSGVEEDIAWLLHRAADYLQTRREPAPARPLYERAHDLRRVMLGDDHPDTLETAGSLSLNLWELGQLEPARRLGEKTLARCRRVLGDDHPHTLTLAHILAATLRKLGQFESARQLGQDTLVRCRRVLGDDHPLTLRLTESLAIALRELGQYHQARQLGEDVLARMRRVLGDNHPHTLESANSLAVTLRALGQNQQARQLGEDVLARMRRVLGDNHPHTLRSARHFADHQRFAPDDRSDDLRS